MKKALLATIIGLSIIACPILYFLVGPSLDGDQKHILLILSIIASCSALYCFIVGELTKNNSQMDKLWSILPIIYTWVIASMGGMSIRLIVIAILTTIWGVRLTFNFALKGAYHLKFWTGKEDYRWVVLREKKEFKPHYKWMLFNLLFISIYQNILVLLITIPSLVSANSTKSFGAVDYVATAFTAFFIIYEAYADYLQWKFQTKKWKMINSGIKLNELPEPYNYGFNTIGLWNVSRHPNYFAEQGTWVAIYLFTIGAGLDIFNWSIIGSLLLIVLFLGSSMFAEEISSAKYPKYNDYKKKTSKFFPWKKYRK